MAFKIRPLTDNWDIRAEALEASTTTQDKEYSICENSLE